MYADDGIEITVPTVDYQGLSTNCSVYNGLTGISTTNGFTSELACFFTGTTYRVQGFNPTPWLHTMTIGWTVHSTVAPMTAPGNYLIRTYYDTTYLAGVLNDYSGNVGGMAIPGPRIFPHEMDFIDWLSAPRIARIGTLGSFTLTLEANVALPAWSAGPNPNILFTLDPSMSIQAQSGLECRLDGMISYQCY
jgi:hypothetical protein